MSVSSTNPQGTSRNRVFSPDDFRRERKPVVPPPQTSRFREREREVEQDRERERQRQAECERRMVAITKQTGLISNEKRGTSPSVTDSSGLVSPSAQETHSAQPCNYQLESKLDLGPQESELLPGSNVFSQRVAPTTSQSTPSPTHSRSGSSPSSATFPSPLIHRASADSIRSKLQEEAEKEWATYRPRSGLPPTVRPTSSLTKSLLSQDESSRAGPCPTGREPGLISDKRKDRGSYSLHMRNEGQEVEAREEAIRAAFSMLDGKSTVHASSMQNKRPANTSTNSNRSSVGSEMEEALLSSTASDPVSSRRGSNRYSRAFTSSPMGRNHSQPSQDSNSSEDLLAVKKPRPKSVQIDRSVNFDLGLPIARQNLSSIEKREKIRRTQKLAKVLGEEILASSGGAEEPRLSLEAVPSNRSILKRIDLNRSRSDSQSPDFLSKSPHGTIGHVESPTFRKHTRTATVDKFKVAGPRKGSRNSFASSDQCSINSLPVNVHPKAAAVLGISSHLRPALNRRRSAVETSSSLQSSVSSFDVEAASTSAEAPGRLTRDKFSSELPSTRSRPAVTSDVASIQSFGSEDDESSVAMEHRIREERRKRVAKMTRWLGAVVPVEMIIAGDSDTAEFAVQADLSPSEESFPTSQRVGFGKAAKVAAMNRLKRRNSNIDNDNSAQKRSDSPSAPEEVSLNLPNGLTPQERFNNVRRANKLANVFGTTPPQQLFASPSPNIAASPTKIHHAHSRSVPAGFSDTPSEPHFSSSERHRKIVGRSIKSETATSRKTKEEETALLGSGQSFVSIDSESSAAYRQSIESLEYLLDHDVPLLSQIVSELDSDASQVDPDSSVNPFIDTDTDGESIDDGNCPSFLPGASSGEETFEASTPTSERHIYSRSPQDEAKLAHFASKSDALRQKGSLDSTSSGDAPDLNLVEDVQLGRRTRMDTSSSICSIDSSTEAQESDSEHDTNRKRAFRARKLNRFFGEAPPAQEETWLNGCEAPSNALRSRGRRLAPSIAKTGSKPAHSLKEQAPNPSQPVPILTSSPAPNSIRKRLAPRSAGSATPASAFARLLNNLEDEILEDAHLKDAERREIAQRVALIKSKGSQLMREGMKPRLDAKTL